MTAPGNHRAGALQAEQRRMARMALLASMWLLAAAVIGATDALGYLAPALVLFALLLLGRYPGERVLARRMGACPPAARPHATRARPRPLAVASLPRGGALLGAALAGRAPPSFAGS